ncbi:NolY [Bradyrhizobium sp. AS23.2]|uniref:NolY n=1 Tax=Bradyrhizobium sp. AS23.2 TaxID=1680155 RepID=UPI001AD827A8|nr:NolY [Bradyrhizobium sp. AS23.2]
MDFDRCSLGVPHPKHGIHQQVEAAVGLICEDKKPLGAVQLVSNVTGTLISAQLESDLLGDTRAGAAVGRRQTAPLQERHGGVFYPEDLQVLGRLFDQAVAALPPAMQTPDNRTTLAKLILARAVAADGRADAFDGVNDALHFCELIRQSANPCCGA